MINIIYAVAVKVNTAKLVTGSTKALESCKFKKKKKRILAMVLDYRGQIKWHLVEKYSVNNTSHLEMMYQRFDKINFDKINILLEVPLYNSVD